MITKELLLEITEKFPDLKLEFSFMNWKTDFFRFYHSQSNYNITKTASFINITLARDKRKLNFNIQNPTKEIILQKIKENIPILEHIPQDTEFVDFDDDKSEFKQEKIIDNTQEIQLKTKINILQKFAEKAKDYNFDIYGTFICNYIDWIFVNSNKVAKKFSQSPIMLDIKAVSNKNEVTVIEKFGSDDFSNFDMNHFLELFTQKINTATNEIVDIEPGVYPVILSPYATAEFAHYFLYNAFGQTLYTKQSYLMDKLNKKVFPELISFYDDPFNKKIITTPYNSDGRLLKKLPIIEKGVFKNFLINKYFSEILNIEINGNELANLVMDTGNDTLDEMISSIENGLYISNIHYMNFINFKETSVTGLTRDGTFLIQNGKLSKVVNNLRFTLKLSDIFSNVTMVENKNHSVPTSSNYSYFDIYSSLMPHIKTEKFHISSSTKTI